MSSYRTLLTVAVEHGYSASGVCSGLNFQPSTETSRLLSNLGILLRPTEGGIQLVYDLGRVDALQMLTGPAAVSFDFRVYASDPDFKNYSEPFGGDAEGILYFFNRAASSIESQLLSAAEMVTDQDFVPAGAGELEDLLTPRDRLLPPDFVLRLFTGERGEHLARWLEAAPANYRIRFASRRRYWKYYLLGKGLGGNNLNIVDSDRKIEFEATGEEILADRRVAYTFRSKQRIPLNEDYAYRFQLKQQGNNGEATLIPRLPHASVKQVGTEMIARQPVIVSEIYVNS